MQCCCIEESTINNIYSLLQYHVVVGQYTQQVYLVY